MHTHVAHSTTAREAPQRWTLASNDVDLQAELLPTWQQSYVQLECGRFESLIAGIELPGTVGLFRKTTNRKLHKVFSTPSDTYALAFLTADSDRVSFLGRDVVGGDTLLLPSGQVFDLVCHGRFDVLVATLPASRIQALVTGPRSKARPWCADIVRAGDESQSLSALLTALTEVSSSTLNRGAPDERLLRNLVLDLEERLISHLSFAAADLADEFIKNQMADAALMEARRILVEEALSQGEVPRVSELAGRLGVSVRLLHHVFRNRMGVAPRSYAQSLRLSLARGDLRAAKVGEVTVAEVAAKWGFWHLGRFASTYRARFGELPSQSLQHC